MKRISGRQKICGKLIPYCIEFDDCYEVVKRQTMWGGSGWSIKKNGEFVDNCYYSTKYAAASTIQGRRYVVESN